jgi:hypothetical protein
MASQRKAQAQWQGVRRSGRRTRAGDHRRGLHDEQALRMQIDSAQKDWHEYAPEVRTTAKRVAHDGEHVRRT